MASVRFGPVRWSGRVVFFLSFRFVSFRFRFRRRFIFSPFVCSLGLAFSRSVCTGVCESKLLLLIAGHWLDSVAAADAGRLRFSFYLPSCVSSSQLHTLCSKRHRMPNQLCQNSMETLQYSKRRSINPAYPSGYYWPIWSTHLGISSPIESVQFVFIPIRLNEPWKIFFSNLALGERPRRFSF